MSRAAYLMDDAREAERLVAKVDADAWVAAHLTPHLATGRSVLEVGCGPGHLLGALTRAVSDLVAVGVDRSAQRLTLAAPAGVSLLRADAAELPFQDGTFDLVYSRFLLEYLSDPLRAVQEMARLCAPGGTVVLQDLDGQLVTHHPPDPELDRGLATVLDALHGRLDPYVGRKLHALAVAAGLHELTVNIEPYHVIAGAADPHTRDQWAVKLDIALPAAVAVLGDEAARQLRNRFLDYLDRPDTLTYSVLFTVTGTGPDRPPR